MKYLVFQTGARRGYSVPAALARAGLLERFYTDIAGNVGVGRLSSALTWVPGIAREAGRLANRCVPADVIPFTKTFAGPWLRARLAHQILPLDPVSQFQRELAAAEQRGLRMYASGVGNATHLYSMLSEAGALMRLARRDGLKVVAEVYILISTERYLEEERRRFPQWEPERPNLSALRARMDQEQYLFNDVDDYLCPSAAVAEDLVANWGVDASRCHLVPYGMNPAWLDQEPCPERGRILFVGTAELRKGIHYLAAAAAHLRTAGRGYQFRVAGHVSDSVRKQRACASLTFLDRVPRHLISREYRHADLFVLPSLAEGSAEVTYEALGAGVPLVVTHATGSVVRDGVEGLIVPERDPVALANAIESIIEDRERRDAMAAAARRRAQEFTWPQYGERLVQTLTRL